MTSPIDRVVNLPFWISPVQPVPVIGGITNSNFIVKDEGTAYFVRIGDDIVEHGVKRFNEVAASRAADAVGLSPKVVFVKPGVMILKFIEGHTFSDFDVRDSRNLQQIVSMISRCHHEIPKLFRGPALIFWVFQILRNYAATLRDDDSRLAPQLPRLMEIADRLEEMVGTIELVFGHNDLLAANFIDDGDRLWMIDWEYAGFNSPLFDLANLASNNGLAVEQEDWLLEKYFDRRPDDGLRRAYYAMKCASLLREAFWSFVSETYSTIDFDYVSYSEQNLKRFENDWQRFRSNFVQQ